MQPEVFLRTGGETLLYAVFFGGIALFGLIETRAALRRTGPDRARRWPTNWALAALNIMVLGAMPVTALAASDWAKGAGVGMFNNTELPLTVTVPASILIFSLQSWAVHFAMHNVPVLWRLHRVHHTDTHMDVSTTVRFHPLELVVQMPVGLAVVALTGAPPAGVILYELADTAINVFSHANIRLPRSLNAVLSRIIVTPHLHAVHHSARGPETDSNFGATLPVWDMLFGTYRAKSAEALDAQTFGLDEMQDERASSLWWAISLPFRQIRRSRGRPASDVALPADR